MSEIKLYNTKSRKIEVFQPQTKGFVTIYTCGPTVYDYPHIGNWASFIYWDILVRTLLANSLNVRRIINITDVGHLTSDADDGEDKLEKGASREGKTAWEIAKFYTADFLNGIKELNFITPSEIVRATDTIPEQLELVKTLHSKGMTYQTSDGIYFDTSKFPNYPNFARLDLENQLAGARVALSSEKRQPWDFAVWKFSEGGKKRDMEWPTPPELLNDTLDSNTEIMGFPGWHLECSSIILKTLGKTIDIHTGGIDHIPVHHTNEIAQSESANEATLANYWLHSNHLKIDNQKISKSLGNSITLHDLESQGYTSMDFRMFVLQSNFQNEANFTLDSLDAAKNRLHNWKRYAELRHQIHNNEKTESVPTKVTEKLLLDALNDNLNTPEALKIVDQVFSTIDQTPVDKINLSNLRDFLNLVDDLLGLKLIKSTPDITEDQKRLLVERKTARANKDWATSDLLRDTIEGQGILINDTPSGTLWNRV